MHLTWTTHTAEYAADLRSPYPGVNQKTNHLPSLRLPTHSSTQPPPALAPTSLTESSAP